MRHFQEDAFNVIYRPVKLTMVADKFIRTNSDFHEHGKDDVFLYRYVSERHEVIRQFSFWTPADTDDPWLASEATGIFVDEAVWKITWRFPRAQISALILLGERRFSNCGDFFEFLNRYVILASEVSWKKMHSSG